MTGYDMIYPGYDGGKNRMYNPRVHSRYNKGRYIQGTIKVQKVSYNK
jgi:hypothetical protein